MEDNKQIIVNINDASFIDKNNKIIIETVERKGDAEEIIQNLPRVFDITTNLYSLPTFISKYIANEAIKDLLKSQCVFYSYKAKEVVYNTDINHLSGINSKITANVKTHEDLKKLKINGDAITIDELLYFIKRHRYYFANQEDYYDWINKVDNLAVNINTDIQIANDFKGNKKSAIEQKVSQQLPNTISFYSYLFEGDPNKIEISCEVEIDIKNNTPNFSFVSLELEQLIETEIKDRIDNTLSLINNIFQDTVPIILDAKR
jgi:hypothetical protein